MTNNNTPLPIARAEAARRFSIRRPSATNGLFHHIRSPGMFARYPLIGVAMFIFGSLVFAFIAHNLVTDGSLVAWDISTSASLRATAHDSPAWVHAIMAAGYYVGEHLVALIGIVLAIYFVRQRCWRELVMVVNGFGISALLFLLLAYTFDRRRPHFDPLVGGLPGFPSGHAVAVVTSYGLLLYFFVPKISSRAGRLWAVAGIAVVGLYIMYSRAFGGSHYPLDLIAGLAVGIAWSGLAHTVVELIFARRKRIDVSRPGGLALNR